MEKHDDEKGETLSREEMKKTKGGLKLSNSGDEGDGPLTLKQLRQETQEGLLDGGFEDFAKKAGKR